MSRSNQMVTVGLGRERFAGPSVLARLHQGSLARTHAIEAARQAELDRKPDPISDLTSGEITTRKLRKLGIVAGGTATLVTLVAIGCKGGGGQPEVQTTPTLPPETPIPTAEPTPTPKPVEILTREQATASLDSIYNNPQIPVPARVCGQDVVQDLLDSFYEGINIPDPSDAAGGSFDLYAELKKIETDTGSKEAGALAESIKILSFQKMPEGIKARGFPEDTLSEVKAVWELNASGRIESGACGIALQEK